MSKDNPNGSGNENGADGELKFEIGETIAGFKLVNKIDEGGFGQVFKVTKDDKTFYAMKIENSAMEGGSAIKLEINVLTQLNHESVFPKFIIGGRRARYQYIVLELLGDNLRMLKARSIHPDCWSDGTWSRLAIQCLYALKKMHDNGFVHRDIKPNNFAVGMDSDGQNRSRVVLLFDFGLARKFINHKTEDKNKEAASSKPEKSPGDSLFSKNNNTKQSKLVKKKGTKLDKKAGGNGFANKKRGSIMTKGESTRTAEDKEKESARALNDKFKFRIARPHTDFRGTFQYASANAHEQLELGRADDIWSLMYMVVEMFTELPWANQDTFPVEDLKNQATLLRLFTDSKNPNRLTAKMNEQLEAIEKMLKGCNYYSFPNYEIIHQFFKDVMTKSKVSWNSPFDWEKTGNVEEFSKDQRNKKPVKVPQWEAPGDYFKQDPWSTLKRPNYSPSTTSQHPIPNRSKKGQIREKTVLSKEDPSQAEDAISLKKIPSDVQAPTNVLRNSREKPPNA
uniref:Protein kinase domain-containing protein n=1 Tax=Caenorhabditis japonica TaxID=281687 RepID=A0A8R1IBT0_CAEJA